MKLKSINFENKNYKLSDDSNGINNIFTVIIGKNGVGKSRLLSKIVDNLLSSHSYSQNHAQLKKNKRQEMTFENNNKTIRMTSGTGKAGRIFQRNKFIKDNMCETLIAASISPFDKFPAEYKLDYLNEFYIYLGFKTKTNSLSDENLLIKFATSIIKSDKNDTVKKTLSLLGYKDEINIEFKHNINRYFKRDKYLERESMEASAKSFYDIVANNKELYKKVLIDNNKEMSFSILKALSNVGELNNKTLNDIVGNEKLTRNFNNKKNELTTKEKESLIKSLEFSSSSIEKMTLIKKHNNQMVELKDSSSGERSLLFLVCSIASKITDNSLILIDEPEISLHPEWQETFIDLIQKAFSKYKRCHFIIATHSPLIISKLQNNDCFILNMDKNILLKSNNHFNRSADYQLARLFDTPGYQNEYLNRLCVSILSDLSKHGGLDDNQMENVTFLESIKDELDKNDNVKVLITIILNTLEMIK